MGTEAGTVYIGWRDAEGFRVVAQDAGENGPRTVWSLHGPAWNSWSNGATEIAGVLLSDMGREAGDADVAALRDDLVAAVEGKRGWTTAASNVARWLAGRDHGSPAGLNVKERGDAAGWARARASVPAIGGIDDAGGTLSVDGPDGAGSQSLSEPADRLVGAMRRAEASRQRTQTPVHRALLPTSGASPVQPQRPSSKARTRRVAAAAQSMVKPAARVVEDNPRPMEWWSLVKSGRPVLVGDFPKEWSHQEAILNAMEKHSMELRSVKPRKAKGAGVFYLRVRSPDRSEYRLAYMPDGERYIVLGIAKKNRVSDESRFFRRSEADWKAHARGEYGVERLDMAGLRAGLGGTKTRSVGRAASAAGLAV